MRLNLILDTNIIISALLSLKSDSPVNILMNKVLNGEFRILITEEILAEYAEVLSRPKFSFSSQKISEFLAFFESEAIFIETFDTHFNLPDPDDLIFFEALVSERGADTFLVTGNQKHFPDWPQIVTPRQFIDYLAKCS